MKLSQSALNVLQRSQRAVVALSGGCDSVALLHFCVGFFADQLPDCELEAVHINHQLSENADHWQDFCWALCEKLGVKLIVKQVQLNKNTASLEREARQKRYQVFNDLLACENSVLLTAHHANDQAETFFYRACRGAGQEGLSGIPSQRRLGKGMLLRPWLHHTREAIVNYCTEHQLGYINDESNNDQRFDRNFIRHTIVNSLSQRWPKAVAKIARACENLDESARLLNEYLLCELDGFDEQVDAFGANLPTGELINLSDEKLLRLLRVWIERTAYGFSQTGEQYTSPDRKILVDLAKQLRKAKSDTHFQSDWSLVSLRFFDGRMYCLNRMLIDAVAIDAENFRDIEYPIQFKGELASTHNIALGKNFRLVFGSNEKSSAEIDLQTFEVRFRQGGEKAQPSERNKSQSLKKLFQEYKVPPWYRYCLPLIYKADELVCVPGVFASSRFTEDFHCDLLIADQLFEAKKKSA